MGNEQGRPKSKRSHERLRSNVNNNELHMEPLGEEEMKGEIDNDFLQEADYSNQALNNGDSNFELQRGQLFTNYWDFSNQPDIIDNSSNPFQPFIPSYKMTEEEKKKFFNENSTSKI